MRISHAISTALMICTMAVLSLAQENIYLQQITTIPVFMDSLEIGTYKVIGDYNADGYPDLAVSMGGKRFPPFYEAVCLYYGRPTFDSIPDLIFRDSTNNLSVCPPMVYAEGFGSDVAALGDFNGDGYDDFAISAVGFCRNTFHEGRIFVYFGGPSAGTIAELLIDGTHDYDYMGAAIASGDFNGDGFSDLIAHAGDIYYGRRMNIFYGGDPPDTALDWMISFPSGGASITDLGAGYDPNNDGYEDFSWWIQNTHYFFWGGDTISHQSVPFINSKYDFFNFDLSGDGIDDFTKYISGQGLFLCLGGAPFDTIPDYPLASWRGDPFIFHWAGHGDKLVCDDVTNQRLIMYNINIPPDTIPLAYLPYGFTHISGSPDIGDINGDGTTEIALSDNSSANPHVDIYTIATTGIEEDEIDNLPNTSDLLYCYPNPFNSSTTFVIDGANQATLGIFDITGRRVAMLPAEHGKAVWDASSYYSGVYFARVMGSDISKSIKLILAK